MEETFCQKKFSVIYKLYFLFQKSDKKGDDKELKPVKEVEIKTSDGTNKTETGCILS